jgi:peptidoglycan hydrolase-like protein with peptidoglycan-binding domain
MTGVADATTLQRYGIWSDVAAPTPTPTPTTSPVGCWVSRELRQGDRGVDVSCLQKAINQHRSSRIAVDGDFGPVTASAVRAFQGGLGLAMTGVADATTLQRYRIWSGLATPTTPPASTYGLPANSGSGRRIVYSRAQQRVWAVDSNGVVVKTHSISGRLYEPYAGTYHVYSRSLNTYSTSDPSVRWRYMVRFAYGPQGGRIGFHEIPNRNGVPLQSNEQLGLPLSSGCVRQTTADALWVWNWAGIGTKVVVL